MTGSRFTLESRRAIVTGASRPRHRAGVRGGRRPRRGREPQAGRRGGGGREIEAAGGTALPVACHVGRRAEIDALVERVVAAWGGVDLLVNNAGTNPAMTPLAQLDESVWDKILAINLKAPFLLYQRVAPLMAAAGGGSIVNVSSVAGTVPWPLLGAYSVSKAGLNSLTKVLARELGPSHIRVNAIAPGLIDTRFSSALMQSRDIYESAVKRTALGRHGVPDDVVGAALFLASDAAAYVTGQTLLVDGGSAL